MKLPLIALVLALFTVSANAQFMMAYNVDTGDFNLSGTEPGPGFSLSGETYFSWDWGSADIATDVGALVIALRDGFHFSGTIDGNPIVTFNGLNFGSTGRGITVQDPALTGAFALDTTTDTLATNLWTQGTGTFIGTASGSGGLGVTEDFTITIVVPEPSSYGLILAGALGVLVMVRRRA